VDERARRAEREAEQGGPLEKERLEQLRRRQGRRPRCPWATGPAKVPPEKDWPPAGWGTTYPWAERVAEWRKRPAKERRAYPGVRLTASSNMPKVCSFVGYGWDKTVYFRWSDGFGFWPNHEEHIHEGKPLYLKRGYWKIERDEKHGCPVFVGEQIEDVNKAIDAEYAQRIAREDKLLKTAMDELEKWKKQAP
jgi:hypothetical protein